MKKRTNFTLTEILMVVLLISVLAGIGFAGYTYARNSARESATRSLIKQLEAGLEAINTKLGYLPAAEEFKCFKITYNDGEVTNIEIGSGSSFTALPDDARKEFLRLVSGEALRKSSEVDEIIVTDSWGGTIYYRNNANNINKSKFDLVSAGPDGVFGTKGKDKPVNDSGEEADRDDFYDGINWGCDDIANFE